MKQCPYKNYEYKCFKSIDCRLCDEHVNYIKALQNRFSGGEDVESG